MGTACCPVPGKGVAGHSVHAPFPGVKTMRWDQLLSGAIAQVRPAPRENLVLGYKLSWGGGGGRKVPGEPGNPLQSGATKTLCLPPMSRAH